MCSGPKNSPVLVLLHGMSFSSTMWYRNVKTWSQSHRVVAIDIIGTPGKSIATRTIRNSDDCAGWLNDVFDKLRIKRACVIGHSFGAWLALSYSARHPERIERIVLLSPAATVLPVVKQFYFRLLLTIVLPFRPVFESFTRWLGGKHSKRAASGELMEQALFGMRHFQTKMKAIPSVFTDDELRKVEMPTLLLVGDREVIYNPEVALARAKALVPSICSRLVEDAGHALPMERPEVVDRYVLEFLG
jgi:pimeloyl-ACP methyl ester carboxylesterase